MNIHLSLIQSKMAGVTLGLFLFLFFLSNPICSGQKNWCKNATNGTHCEQTETGNCVGYKKSLLTPDDKNYLLRAHNSLRENMTNEVAETRRNLPKALYIKKLAWNEALAKMAQKWADNCNATTQPRLLYQNQLMGQLVLTVDRNKSLADALHGWTHGLNFLNSEIIYEYRQPAKNESDYEAVSQMMWWDTSELGCGRSNYESTKCNEKNAKCEVTELVCNYFPAGNREGYPVYLTKKDRTLLCRYDPKHALCQDLPKKIKTTVNELNDTQHLDMTAIGNRIKERMRELWPAFAKASLARESQSLYVLLLLATFNVYENLLRN